MRLERAVVHRVRWPLAGGGAARGWWREREGAVLVVEADGERGRGEASPLPGHGADAGAGARAVDELERFARALPLVIDEARPLAAIAALVARCGEPAARFAIEAALLELCARRRGVTLAALCGADADAVARPLAIARVVDDVAGAGAAVAAGRGTLKLKRGDADLIAAVRRAAPDARLRLDVNQGWQVDEVDGRLAVVAEVAGAQLEYVEEPAAALVERLGGPRACPLALDESLARDDREAWLDRALASGAVAALVLKPTVLGGIGACLALAGRARARGVDAVASHTLEGPIAHAACVELARVLGGTRAHGVDVYAEMPAWRW